MLLHPVAHHSPESVNWLKYDAGKEYKALLEFPIL
jgi:hypothetical protein